MIPNPTKTAHHIGSSSEEIRFGLDASATAHLISVLTDLYSDPIAAVIREYSTNALDSHIDAGVRRPIEVTLPTALNRTFSVQDFGIGLDVEALKSIYSLYGRSTKRDSDEVNGVLGLGCKSALTYAVTFNVTAIKNGVRTLAAITKDEDGVGTIKVLDVSETDGPNGVRIDVPVKQYDVDKFRSKAADFYRYWRKGTVLVNGEVPVTIWDDSKLIWIDDDVAVTTSSEYDSVVVQHGVAYPVRYGFFRGYEVIAFVPSGTVNFTPSREALHYTTRTEETLNVLKDYVEAGLTRTIKASLDGATPYRRLEILAGWRRSVPKIVRDLLGEIGTHVRLAGTAWRFDSYSHRNGFKKAAAKVESVQWFDLVNSKSIVTDFPFKSLNALTRARLADQYSEEVLVFPAGTNLSAIAGRPKVRSWDDIVASTEHVKVTRAAGSKSHTFYAVWVNGQVSSLDADEVADLTVTLTFDTAKNGRYFSQRLGSDAAVIEIKQSQADKLQRLFPDIVTAQSLVQSRLNAAVRNLSDEDRLALTARHFSLAWLEPKVDVILDPDLRRVLKARYHTSEALEALLTLGGGGVNPHTLPTTVQARYSLLTNVYGASRHVDDAVLYVNAKYESLSLTTGR